MGQIRESHDLSTKSGKCVRINQHTLTYAMVKGNRNGRSGYRHTTPVIKYGSSDEVCTALFVPVADGESLNYQTRRFELGVKAHTSRIWHRRPSRVNVSDLMGDATKGVRLCRVFVVFLSLRVCAMLVHSRLKTQPPK